MDAVPDPAAEPGSQQGSGQGRDDAPDAPDTSGRDGEKSAVQVTPPGQQRELEALRHRFNPSRHDRPGGIGILYLPGHPRPWTAVHGPHTIAARTPGELHDRLSSNWWTRS
ncbi:hypothetical protein [Actinomadura hibisca]|uniref:hypothetical protein n=1 Tax=Actinomadura hibisca TaxID=68565 RepID=UPI000836867F|nr:hypothetical protein [Actinomadura hibisca]